MEKVNIDMQKFDFFKIEVGVRFKIFREIIDKTETQLAMELGVPTGEIKEIEAGRVFPAVTILHYLYEHYGLNVNWLLGKVGDIFNEKDPKKLAAFYNRRFPNYKRDTQAHRYAELLDLMEIPVIEESIMATLIEIKALLKKRASEESNR